MPYASVDLSTFDMRNMWPLASGGVAVRPGLRKVYSAESGRTIVWAATVPNAYTDSVWHYVVDIASTGAADVYLRIYDENFVAIQARQLGTNTKPRAVTHAVLDEQVFIGSPDFPTQWGYVGTGTVRAARVATQSTTLTALAIPKGLCVAWQDRLAVADGTNVYLSDALAPRTFISDNVTKGPWDGATYGLHVDPTDGALVAVTSNGVWSLPADASATATVFGIWNRDTEHVALDFNTSAVSRGRIFGTTRKGLRQLYPPGEEWPLDEQHIPRQYDQPVISEDWREARCLGAQEGPMVAYRGQYLHRVDLATGLRSWWDAVNQSAFDVVGVLYDRTGEEMFVSGSGAFRAYGNFDGDEALTSEDATAIRGGFAGRVQMPPHTRQVVRDVQWSTDTGGSMYHSVCGTSTGSVAPTQGGIVTNTDSWDDGNKYQAPKVQSGSVQHAVDTDDVSLELLAEHPRTQVALSASVKTAGPGRETRRV